MVELANRITAKVYRLILNNGLEDVSQEELTGEATPHRYEATVVVYILPINIAATEKYETPERALKGALSAVERQVPESRDKLHETWK